MEVDEYNVIVDSDPMNFAIFVIIVLIIIISWIVIVKIKKKKNKKEEPVDLKEEKQTS